MDFRVERSWENGVSLQINHGFFLIRYFMKKLII